MGEFTAVSAEDQAIGERVRVIRRRRGLSAETAAGLAGIDKSFLSRLERGERAFVRRGLLENLATALGCSVADLTGQPYLSVDRDTQAALAAIPDVAATLHDCTLSDVPDVPARPIGELVTGAAAALAYSDNVELHRAGDGLGALLTELHVHAVTGDGDTKRTALAALVEACIVARALAGTMGHVDLAVAAARRGYDAARTLERPDLIGFMAMGRTMTLGRVGARRRALRVASQVLAELPTGPAGADTRATEARGMLHLSAALISARGGSASDAETHLGEARALAEAVGERNALRFHFGRANVAAWDVAVAVENGTGPDAAARFEAAGIDPHAFHSRDREASVHLDLARAWAQADGDRDGAVVRALDTADRLAPIRVRSDPIARDLVVELHRRARRRVWELDSLRNRLGVA
ncbi:MAG: helix-turn-helix transcriptional regulator [Pseudonocardia sp.]|nr:helix-turn-helix transcriptional regulator [Pseudonocardia sp.]